MGSAKDHLRDNVERVRATIADAATRAGRDAAEVTLVAVSKTQPAELVAEVAHLGIEHFGENRVQEAQGKVPRVRELLGHDATVLAASTRRATSATPRPAAPNPIAPRQDASTGCVPTWHMIGSLQRNKVRACLELFDLVHSVDSARLAEAIYERAEGRTVAVLLEVYFGDDPARPGFRPDDLLGEAAGVLEVPSLDVRGLMTVAPLGGGGGAARSVFRRLRELRDELRAGRPGAGLDELSMGMTDDYPLAIEEGATIVRVGRAIFGERATP